ncbi:unnamed protein product [Mytilus coruscus]|uniref:DED domain-containing protein n=1 Tax=Mytilus coruscus TaxID=42192 RepID=A0A6J8DSV2_MYTCO|nr:unnamed protein product [Mytilus coruscus]
MEIDVNAGATFENPSLDYQLNVCLGNISKEITENELTHMKFLLSGNVSNIFLTSFSDGGTPRGVLEKISTPLKLFEHLKGRCLLSRENILYIQAMLYHAGRIDLFNKMLDFAKQRGETLHCFPESETPVYGYKFVKVHVAGTDNYNRSTLEAIQSTVSAYMNVPSHFVTVQGIQATQSYLITFMVPEHCIEFLTVIKPAEKRCLLSLGVDFIMIEGTTIALEEKNSGKEPVQELQLNKELQNCFIRNASLKKQLEHYQLNEMNAGINVPSNLSRSLTLLITFLFNIVKNRTTEFIGTISIASAHNYFQHCLDKVKGLGYDMHVIDSLLEAQSIIVRKQNLESHRLLIQQQQYQIEDLENCIGVLQAERAKLKYVLGQSVYEQVFSENDRPLFVYCINGSLPFLLVQIGLDNTLDQLKPYLKEASTFLTKTDTERLIQGFDLNQDEEKMFRGGKRCFIEALIIADLQKSGDFDIGWYIIIRITASFLSSPCQKS